MPKNEVTITEIEEFEPSRVDGVGKGANGFPILMLKSIGDEAVKADDRSNCKTCDGDGKILNNQRKCPDCLGTGKAPKVGESAKQFIEAVTKEDGVAPSGAPYELTEQDCPTCNGSGTIADASHDGKMCPDCGGTGIDQMMTNPKELNAVAADPGRISVGDPEGRETMDKQSGSGCPGCAVAMANGDDKCPECGAKVEKGHDFEPNGFRPAPYQADADETVQCPDCQLMNDLDSAYCDQCGHELAGDDDVTVDGKPADLGGFRPMPYHPDADETVGCPKCELMNDLDAAYCDQCGHQLAGDDKVVVDGQPLVQDDDDATKGSGETIDDVLRHDKGHDDWHAMHGDPPCKSEADCAAMRAKYDDSDATKSLAGFCTLCTKKNVSCSNSCMNCGKSLVVSKEKADPSVGGGTVRSKIADEDFAGKNRSFPIVTPADVSDAASSMGRAGADNYATDTIKANIIAIAQRKGPKFVAELPQAWKDDMAEKADGSLSGVNPSLGAVVTPMPNDDDTVLPGSPSWEAVDAATATQAAQSLMEASELIRQFAQRESIEVAAGEGNDLFDEKAAEMALIGVTAAIGVMAQLAFHEGLEAQKSLEEEGTVEKAGKRLSGKAVAALAAARDHLNIVLGQDDPALQTDDDADGSSADAKYIQSANKALLSKELEDMSTDELEKVLNARDERLVELLADAMKGKVLDDQTASVDSAKTVKSNSKKKNPKAEMTDLEDEAAQGDHDSANTSPEGAAKADGDVSCKDCGAMCKADDKECAKCGMAMKAELTEEEIEAKKARKEAKKALKAAQKAEKEAAENAAVQKAIAEGVAEATTAVIALQERLSTVEKMAAPSTIVRTRPQDALTKSVERDELEMRLAHLERVARETPDQDIRKASREESKEIRDRIAGLSA